MAGLNAREECEMRGWLFLSAVGLVFGALGCESGRSSAELQAGPEADAPEGCSAAQPCPQGLACIDGECEVAAEGDEDASPSGVEEGSEQTDAGDAGGPGTTDELEQPLACDALECPPGSVCEPGASGEDAFCAPQPISTLCLPWLTVCKL